MHIYIYIFIYLLVHIFTYTYKNIYLYMCVCVCVCSYIPCISGSGLVQSAEECASPVSAGEPHMVVSEVYQSFITIIEMF